MNPPKCSRFHPRCSPKCSAAPTVATLAPKCPRFQPREQEAPGDTGPAPDQLVQCGISCSVAKVITAGGSGINDQRPKFLALLANPQISRIVVEHKDRASRFGVAYIQTLLAMQERELVVVNTADTVEDALMGDFVAIITSFAARLYGRRRAKRKTALVLAALQQNGTTHEPQTRES